MYYHAVGRVNDTIKSTLTDKVLRFFDSLTYDGYLADDVSTRFEVWHRAEELAKDIAKYAEEQIYDEAKDQAYNMDMDNFETLKGHIEDTLYDLEDGLLKKVRGGNRALLEKAIDSLREHERT